MAHSLSQEKKPFPTFHVAGALSQFCFRSLNQNTALSLQKNIKQLLPDKGSPRLGPGSCLNYTFILINIKKSTLIVFEVRTFNLKIHNNQTTNEKK